MIYKAKFAVCSEIRTKHSTQSEHHVEFWNVWGWWYIEKPLGFKRLKQIFPKFAYVQKKTVQTETSVTKYGLRIRNSGIPPNVFGHEFNL